MKYLLFIFILLIISNTCFSQDIHWSQFNANPLFQNPGNAGHFHGDYRFVGNYRDQWRSVTVPFQTLSISSDLHLMKQPEAGVGLQLMHDVVGDGNFRTIEIQLSGSYLLKVTQDSTHTIRPGLNVGLNHRQLNFNAFSFDNQYDGEVYNPTFATGELIQTDRKTNASIGIGTIYEYYQNERFNITGGIGFYNLNRPNQGFYSDVIKRDIRTSIFAKGIYKLNYDWDLVPALNLSIQGKYRELLIGSSVKYTLINKLGQYRALYAGAWYRNKDAAFLSVGMDYQTWFFGLSYDINFSKLVPASRGRGGLEFAVRYILHHFKPKKISHRICPDYI